MSDSKQSRKINRFFAEFIAKLRKWLNKIGSSIRIDRRFVRQLLGATKGQGKKAKNAAGFVLPTVTLVTLVVTLLVVTTVARSSDRARSAANSRAEQVFRVSATPSIDRARAKIEALLTDDKLPRTTPPELILDNVITGDSGKYTFPDETRLQLVYNIDPANPKIEANDPKIEKREYASTAWKFPIDTDNNGKFDSYGLYSILFRARTETNRPISPLEARSLPMDETALTGACVATGGVTNVATQEGWSPSSDNKLKKAFFVYAATVPIKSEASFPANANGNYETYSGATTISAVELQQDRARSPQNNNAVWFEGDSELVNVATFRLNGRVYTSGNLMVGTGKDLNVTFYQVSSSGDNPSNSKLFGSCYYEKKNSEIVVAGNVVEGDASFSDVAKLSPDTDPLGNGGNVKVHLFQGVGVRPDQADGVAASGSKSPQLINETNQSVDSAVTLSKDVALNDFAYSRRVKALVDAAIARGSLSITKALPAKTLEVKDLTSVDPPSVMEDVVKRILDEGLSDPDDILKARRAALTSYFKERTRKVSFGEVPLETPETIPTTASDLFSELTVTGQTNKELVPRIDWMLPTYSNGATFGRPVGDFVLGNKSNFDGSVIAGTGQGSLKLLIDPNNANNLALSASEPATVTSANKEFFLGDRVLVGNNLPARWLKYNSGADALEFVGDTESGDITTNSSVTWNSSTSKRYRNTRAFPLSNLGVSDRGGFWELSAAADPSIVDSSVTPIKKQDEAAPRVGGLRVVTNSGIYSRLPKDTFLPRFRTGYSDDPATTTVDESSAPVWDGKPQNNPITPINELNFASPTANFVVWQDSMPMTGTVDTRKGDLQMRANAIYHYKYSSFDSLNASTYQLPIACVSSYYDPTNPTTAKNGKAIDGTTNLPWNYDPNGRSNNGIVYDVKATASSISGISYSPTTGLFTYASGAEDPSSTATSLKERLSYQANLIFPNGRFANEQLRNVLIKLASGGTGKLTLPEQSTLDSNICALTILDGSSVPNVNALPSVQGGIQLPHGTFREATFLDAREVKSLNRNESLTEAANGNNSTTSASNYGLSISAKNRGDIYDLQIEQRQPLEVRVTDIDIDRLRGAKVTGQPNNNSAAGVPTEYLLPYSGVVYATREDALADLSYYDIDGSNDPKVTDLETRKTFSSLDFRLDPTRRPSGIRLINGYRLWRSELISANLSNVDGTVDLSDTDYTKAAYKFSEVTKGEKGLILVSDLPVYVKAQYDPKASVVFDTSTAITTTATAPAFNKHTQEEFTAPLNEAISTISNPAGIATATANIWNNFYTRHADNGAGDKLNPNFACRPSQNTGCIVGDQWRSATIIADSATVLSASFLDGYRRDGDFDIRNNANTSTSLNWQSQLNPNDQKQKDSSYVVERRRLGFFNNNFVTSANWMRVRTPDDKQWTASTQPTLWMGNPQTIGNQYTAGNKQTRVPQNGNMSSYNANGVTPVQRRLNFHEYGMEMCRKLPLSECTFSDWIKGDTGATPDPENSAGTTALPTIAPATGLISTPTDAPRYISASNWRYPRRLSFMRYDDLYKDGNMQLVMGGQCAVTANSRTAYTIPIGVFNGDLSTGFTYPQFMGIPDQPLDASGTNNNKRNSYGTVPCPEIGMTVEILNTPANPIPNLPEGRRITFHKNPIAVTKNFSLFQQLGNTDNLPDVVWGTGNDDGNANPTEGSVTNSPDNNEPIANGGNYYKEVAVNVPSTDPAPGVSQPIDDTEYSTNNAVYRRFDFQVRLNNRNLLAAGETARVRVTLFPENSAVPALTATSITGRARELTTPTLTRQFNATVPPQTATPTRTIRSASTTVAPSDNPATGGDYINRLYNPRAYSVKTPQPSNAADITTADATENRLFPRLPVGTQATTDSAAPNSSSTAASAIDSAFCPENQYCTILSWTGPTAPATTSPTGSDDDIKLLSVLVVRDSANENNETFRLTLDNVVRSSGGKIGYVNTRNAQATIQVYDAGNPNRPTPCGTGNRSYRLSGYDDREFLGASTAANCPTPPTPTPPPVGGDGGGGMLPGYFVHSYGHLSAAYPFKFINTPQRPFNPPSANNNTGTAAGRYRWGVDLDGNPTIDNDAENRFPDIPEDPETLGEVPMLPADPNLSPTATTLANNNQGMTRDNPPRVDRALWYRTTNNYGDPMGTSSRTRYERDKMLYINNLSYPDISGSDSNRANLNTLGRLMLPDTVCINSATGDVDERCLGKQYAVTGNSSASDTILNLNLPYNPHYPSDEFSTNGDSQAANKKPATVFAVCGATGNSEKTFQPTQRLGRTDITGSSCPIDPRTAIVNFIGTAPTSTFPNLTGGTGLQSARLVPANTGTDEFKGVIPDDTNKSDRTAIVTGGVKTGSAIDVTLRAKNTYSSNKVNVYNLKDLGSLSGTTRTLSGRITLRANCVLATDTSATPANTACTPTSRRLGPSPVFILRAETTEDITFDTLKVQLDGVDPNNVFWVFPKIAGDQNLVFKGNSKTNPSIVTGNFIGTMPATVVTATVANSTDLNILDVNTSFRGVRFLGFRAVAGVTGVVPTQVGVDGNTLMAALTSVDQPELQPVLQLHFPNRTTADTNTIFNALQPLFFDANNDRSQSGINGFPQTDQGQWTIRPVRSEVNAYFVAGNSPIRNGISYTTSLTAPTSSSVTILNASSASAANVPLDNVGETAGGLNNFIRLLENWEAIPLKITGGFLQNSRSKFATAPYAATSPIISNITGVPSFSDIQTIFINPVLPNIRMSNFNLQYQSITPQRIPFFSAPIRLWGYDVALLTQQPDRFAERFATPIAGANEFFREVSGDDPWVEALLCALEPNDPEDDNTAINSTVNIGYKKKFGTSPTNYTVRALRGNDLPNRCTTTTTYGGASITPASYD
jgi:hypothetical protein